LVASELENNMSVWSDMSTVYLFQWASTIKIQLILFILWNQKTNLFVWRDMSTVYLFQWPSTIANPTYCVHLVETEKQICPCGETCLTCTCFSDLAQ
jgi:hypothetical protein